MKKLFLAAALAPALFLTAPAQAQRAGVYEVTGTNLDGSSYQGIMEMQQVGTATYHILWNIGGQLIEGVGMASGLTFATAFTFDDQTGIGIYEIKPGDLLEGTWTIVGAAATGTETARPAEAPAEGAPAPSATPAPDGTPAPEATPAPETTPGSPPADPALPPARN